MMAKKTENANRDVTAELLRDLLIVELYKARVPQLEIRKIVGCDVHRVNRIAKALRKGLKKTDGVD
jgi:hypothetical protein